MEKSSERSPCVSRCELGVGNFCLGCARSLGDIARWSAMGSTERAAAAARARQRMSWSRLGGRTRAMLVLGAGDDVVEGGLALWNLPTLSAWLSQATSEVALAMEAKVWPTLTRQLVDRPMAVVVQQGETFDLADVGPESLVTDTWTEAQRWALNMGRPLCVVGGPELGHTVWDLVGLAWIIRVEGPMEIGKPFDPDLTGFEAVAEGPQGSDGAWSWSSALWVRTPDSD